LPRERDHPDWTHEQIAAQVPAVRDRLDIVAMILNEGPEGLPRGLVALPANKKE
jgi:hypothetical protein